MCIRDRHCFRDKIDFNGYWSMDIYRCSLNLLHATSQIGHFVDGIQRLLEPVSNMTLKVWGGVPMSIGP